MICYYYKILGNIYGYTPTKNIKNYIFLTLSTISNFTANIK